MANLAPLWLKLRHYDDTKRLEQDVTYLLKNYSTLKPKVNLLTYGARKINLLFLYGTLPIVYFNNTYHIPITVFFDPPYPFHPPRCFVTPTHSMEIKKNHRYVSTNGAVCHPFLINWDSRISSLIELLRTLAADFSADPPVFAVNRNSADNSQNVPEAQPWLQELFAAHPNPSFSQPEPQQAAPCGQPSTNISFPSVGVPSQPEYFADLHRAALDDLTCVQQHTINLQQSQKKLLEISDHLRSHVIAREQMLEVLDECKTALDAADKTAKDFIARENSVKDDVSRLYKVENSFSNQILELTAEIAAREDLVFEYDNAFKSGCKTSSEYLRGLRENFREIFMAEMLSRKILAQKQKAPQHNQNNSLWMHHGV